MLPDAKTERIEKVRRRIHVTTRRHRRVPQWKRPSIHVMGEGIRAESRPGLPPNAMGKKRAASTFRIGNDGGLVLPRLTQTGIDVFAPQTR